MQVGEQSQSSKGCTCPRSCLNLLRPLPSIGSEVLRTPFELDHFWHMLEERCRNSLCWPRPSCWDGLRPPGCKRSWRNLCSFHSVPDLQLKHLVFHREKGTTHRMRSSEEGLRVQIGPQNHSSSTYKWRLAAWRSHTARTSMEGRCHSSPLAVMSPDLGGSLLNLTRVTFGLTRVVCDSLHNPGCSILLT